MKTFSVIREMIVHLECQTFTSLFHGFNPIKVTQINVLLPQMKLFLFCSDIKMELVADLHARNDFFSTDEVLHDSL